MAEAVRKVMYRQYQVMLDNEAGCRKRQEHRRGA